TTQSEILLQCRHAPLPLKPPKPGERPQRKEGIHVRTFSTDHGVSLAGPLLLRVWTLKTGRGLSVSHSPEVSWDMQFTHRPCLFSVPSLTSISQHRVTQVNPLVLSSRLGTAKEAGWKCLEACHAYSMSLLGCLWFCRYSIL
uniref:Uncharacterized protein n=1 Tax=Capra hircus TaxID=9925 RepID=A0A452EPS6_CAPHI